MANTVLNPSVIAKVALKILDNNLVWGRSVYRGYENEFGKSVNGYEIGQTLTIRKPAQFTVRQGATASMQDVTEGTTTMTVNKQAGVDFKFSSLDLTMNIKDLAERVIKPLMVPIANQIDADIAALALQSYNWVGAPANGISTYANVAAATRRMDEVPVPDDGQRRMILTPADVAGLKGAAAALFNPQLVAGAFKRGSLGEVDGMDTAKSQNVASFTTGARGGAPLINGAAQNVTYAGGSGNSDTQSLITDGWTASITGVVKAGDVFTIAGVFAVNRVTKAVLPYLQQFVVTADANSSAGGAVTLTIAPQIIASGAFQTVSAAPADNAALTFLGSASTTYQPSVAFHTNAFAFVSVPLVMPPGAIGGARESYKGISIRLQPYYDGTNDVSQWRADVLYGVKALDMRLATRVSG